MHIEELSLRHFRNIQQQTLALVPGTVVLRGQNAQGKTNVLEALYVAATGKSFRQAPPREMVQHDAAAARLDARFVRQGVRHDVQVDFAHGRRHVRIDGRGLRQRTKLLEVVNVVAFFPDDLRIVKGSPEERRRFLDRTIANHRPDFVDATLAYNKALKSRNALLRSERAPDAQLLSIYDEQLIQHGDTLNRCRQDVLTSLQPYVDHVFSEVMGETAALHVSLDSGIHKETTNTEKFKETFEEALSSRRAIDRMRGNTTVGPHRADLVMSLSERPARSYGSQGQQRAIVLALKLAEVQHLSAVLGTAPILLLDDVSSELDRRRTEILFKLVSKLKSQIWVSTTGSAPLPLPENVQLFDVHAGEVQKVARST